MCMQSKDDNKIGFINFIIKKREICLEFFFVKNLNLEIVF